MKQILLAFLILYSVSFYACENKKNLIARTSASLQNCMDPYRESSNRLATQEACAVTSNKQQFLISQITVLSRVSSVEQDLSTMQSANLCLGEIRSNNSMDSYLLKFKKNHVDIQQSQSKRQGLSRFWCCFAKTRSKATVYIDSQTNN